MLSATWRSGKEIGEYRALSYTKMIECRRAHEDMVDKRTRMITGAENGNVQHAEPDFYAAAEALARQVPIIAEKLTSDSKTLR